MEENEKSNPIKRNLDIKVLAIVVLLIVLVGGGIYNFIQKDNIDNEIAELSKDTNSNYDNYTEYIKTQVAKIFPNSDVVKIANEQNKTLQICIYQSQNEILNNSNSGSLLGSLLGNLSQEDWFDYNYICTNFYVKNYGLLMSQVFDIPARRFYQHIWDENDLI